MKLRDVEAKHHLLVQDHEVATMNLATTKQALTMKTQEVKEAQQMIKDNKQEQAILKNQVDQLNLARQADGSGLMEERMLKAQADCIILQSVIDDNRARISELEDLLHKETASKVEAEQKLDEQNKKLGEIFKTMLKKEQEVKLLKKEI